jgi:Co/Zn/Cd efflux system component
LLNSSTSPKSNTPQENSTTPLLPQDVDQAAKSDKGFFDFLSLKDKDVNIQSAIIHVIGDLVSSLGVLLASIVIMVRPDWVIVDPFCTFFFSIFVMLSTYDLMKTSLLVLMQGKHFFFQLDQTGGLNLNLILYSHAGSFVAG